MENIPSCYIFDQNLSNVFVISYARLLYIHALEKSFVVNVHKVNHNLSYEFDA